MTAAKPLPVADEWSAGYWDAAARGEIALPRCSACSHFALPPTMVCPVCGTTDPRFVYEVVERGGAIRSWTVVRDAFLPGFEDELPYVLVDVELDAESGLRMIGRLVEGTAATLRIGDRVTVVFDTVTDDVAVPSFTLAVT
jgi:uncharacterized protein